MTSPISMANLTGPNHLMIGEAKCSQGFMSWDREKNFSVSVPKLLLVDDWQTKWIPNQEKTRNWCIDTQPVSVTWRNLAFSDPLSTDVDLTAHCSNDWLVSPMYDIHFATMGGAGELRDEKPLLTCIPEQFQFNYYIISMPIITTRNGCWNDLLSGQGRDNFMPRSILSNRPACSPMCKLPQLFKGYRTSAINTYFLSTQKKNELGYLIQSTLCVWLCIHNSSARCFFLSRNPVPGNYVTAQHWTIPIETKNIVIVSLQTH